MERQYRFADPSYVIVLFLDAITLFLFAQSKIAAVIIGLVVLICAGFRRAYFPADLSVMISEFDINALIIIAYTLYAEIAHADIRYIIPSVMGSLLALLWIMIMRSGNNFVKGKAVIVVILIIAIILGILLCSYVAAPAGEVVVSGWNLLMKGLKAIWNLYLKLIDFLARVLPDASKDGAVYNPVEIKPEISDEMMQAQPRFDVLALVLGAILLAGIIYALVNFFKNHKIVKFSLKKRNVYVSKKRKAPKTNHGLWSKIIHELKMLAYMTKNTQLAHYYRLVYSKRLSPERKKKNETPREFLIRINDTSFTKENIDAIEQELYC